MAQGTLSPSILTSVTSNLGPGMSNDPNQVKALQQALVQAGYLTQAQMSTGPGIYGPQTTAAVAAWQSANNIPTNGNTGYFGPVSKNFIQTGNVPSSTGGLSASTIKSGNTTPVDHAQFPDGMTANGTINSGIPHMNQDQFSSVVTKLEPGTPAFQDAMNKIDTTYYDVLEQQMNAKTEQEHQAAQYNWQNFKKNIETNLNINLSNDAFQAWDQIKGIKNTYGQQNLEGSGIQNEATDEYLRKMRNVDASTRTQATSRQDQNQMDYYMKFATPEQVKAFIASNPDQAKSWGLVPSDNIKNSMSFSALKAKYPNLSDEEINQYVSNVLDENGNYRSTLYQNYMNGGNPGAQPGATSISYNPDGTVRRETVSPGDYGIADIRTAKNQYQSDMAMNRNDAALAASKMSTDPQSVIDSTRPYYSQTPAPGGSTATGALPTPRNPITPTASTGTSSSIDYTLHQGETVAAYNARIAAARGETTSPSTTSSYTAPKTTTTSPYTAPKTTAPSTSTTTPTTTTKTIDYTLHPGETITAYNARIAAARGS